MPDINPLRIFMFVIQTASALVGIVILVVFSGFLAGEVRTDEFERFSVEMAENMLNSQLTSSKYVFDKSQLDSNDQTQQTTELPFLRGCSFGYFAEVEDLRTEKKWSFGYKLSGKIAPDEITSKKRDFYVSINVPNQAKPANFYETVNQARFTLTVYDTWFTRITCMIEKAFDMKKVQSLTLPSCVIPPAKPDGYPCFSIKRNGDKACYVYKFGGTETGMECRYLPSSIRFEEFYKTPRQLTQENIPLDKMILRAYPVKNGPVPTCGELKSSTAFLPTNEDVMTVVLCMEVIS